MNRPTLILAALAALCAAPAGAAVTKPSTIACERPSHVLALMDIAQRPRSDANRDEFTNLRLALRDLGYCVEPPAGTRVTVVSRHESHLVEVILEGEVRRFFVMPTSIDWSAE